MMGWLRNALRPVARSVTPGDRFALFSSDAGRALLRRVLASGQIEVVADAAADPDIKEAAEREGFGAAVALPLQVRGRTVGVASVYFDSAETLQSSEALSAIEQLRGAHVAIAPPPLPTPAPAAAPTMSQPSPQPGASGPSMMELVSAIMGEAVGRLDAEFDRAEEMSEANRLKSEFISVISHELRSPLTYVYGFSEILANRDVSTEQLKHVASSIHRESELMLRMVEELLDLSSIEQGKYPINPEPIDLGVQVARTVERAQPTATNHTLVAESPPDLVVMADPNRLQQVILNLVNNAVRYSPNGGTITVRAAVEDTPTGRPAMARVDVADQGVGIPPHELQRIFERFHRVDNELKKKVRGSGLGLSICQAIVEGHAGRIWVESEVGKGSTFKFTLPLAAGARPADEPTLAREAKVS
jgi:signal transduction histidine kinase